MRLDARALQSHVECVEDTEALRDSLPAMGLVAFVGNGAILPRCGAQRNFKLICGYCISLSTLCFRDCAFNVWSELHWDGPGTHGLFVVG